MHHKASKKEIRFDSFSIFNNPLGSPYVLDNKFNNHSIRHYNSIKKLHLTKKDKFTL